MLDEVHQGGPGSGAGRLGSSASESVINSLRGVDVEVVQVGSTTCGKPYGFYPADNCGTTYLSIQFKGVNAGGFGDYADGFTPDPAGGNAEAMTPGCLVPEDYTHALGAPQERRLAATLVYRESRTCPEAAATTSAVEAAAVARLGAVDGRVHKPPWLENRLLKTAP